MKVGVIGCGFWGRKHVEEYRALGMDVAWVADKSTEGRKFAQGVGVPNVTDEVENLLRSDVEAVSICTPNNTHFALAFDAITAGKHVLVEKPMTTGFESSQVLVEHAKHHDMTLAVGHVFRFNNAINEVRRLFQDGSFGDAYTIINRWTTLCPSPLGRDIVFDLAPHAFDIMHHVLGEWPERVTAVGQAYRRVDLEEAAFITAEFPGGCMGHIEASWLLPGKVRSVELVGSSRAAHVNALTQDVTVHEEGRSYEANVEANNTIRGELCHFIDAIRNGDEATNGGEIGRDVVKCLDATVQSMRERRSVEVSW